MDNYGIYVGRVTYVMQVRDCEYESELALQLRITQIDRPDDRRSVPLRNLRGFRGTY